MDEIRPQNHPGINLTNFTIFSFIIISDHLMITDLAILHDVCFVNLMGFADFILIKFPITIIHLNPQ